MTEEQLWNDTEFARLLFECARDAILITRRDGIVFGANSMASQLFGYSHEELIERRREDLLETFTVSNINLDTNSAPLFESKGATKEGGKIPLEVSIADFSYNNEWFQIYIIRDISYRKAVEDEMYRMANIDPLTELPNRRYMQRRIQQERDRAERSKKQFSFIMTDIDGFKQFNDNYGHDCGDYVLQEIASILENTIRKQDLVARWGGEEFLFLLPETSGDGAVKTAEKIRERIETNKFHYRGLDLGITMTFGVTSSHWDDNIGEQIKKADTALLLGKNKGKNCVVYQ